MSIGAKDPCKCNPMSKPTGEENCCDKCNGVVRDENNFGRDYGCLKDDCDCHVTPLPKKEEWEEAWHNIWYAEDTAFEIMGRKRIKYVGGVIKEFISNLLTSQRNKILQEVKEWVKNNEYGDLLAYLESKTKLQ